jgi:hypothetical protein
MADPAWLRYANQGATRSQPLSPQLVDAFGRFLPQLGVTAQVFSGGQPTASEGGARTGSVRHDHGNAGDVFFLKDGRKLDWANPQDLPIFQEIVRQGKAAGLTGFGAGPGYMQPGSMHIGYGHPGVWGAGGSSRTAPSWLVEAYGGVPAEKPLPTYDSLMASSAPTAQTPTMANVQNKSFDPVGEVIAAGQGGSPLAAMFAGTAAPGGVSAPYVPQDANPVLGNLALMFAQQQADRRRRQEDEQEAEQVRKAALFSADSVANLYG